MKKIMVSIQILVLAVVSAVFAWPATSNALTNTQFALSGSGSQANLASSGYRVTPSGKYVLFTTSASYVVGGDTNAAADVFLRDTINNSTVRVSVASNGDQANGGSWGQYITNNGRYILFNSSANNIADVSGVSNYTAGVYLHDMKTGATELIAAGRDTGSGFVSYSPDSLSEDARFVYYDGLTPGDQWRVYAKDRLLSTTEQISKSAAGTAANTGQSQGASTSCDGRFVVFQSSSTNLVSSDINDQYDIFLVDRMNTHAVKNLTISGDAMSTNPTISCDGNFVIFASQASNIVTGDTNSATDIFMYDVPNDSYERVSVGTGGSQMPDNGGGSASADGRYVTFESYVNNDVTPTSKSWQVYVRDRQNDTTTLLSKNTSSDLSNCDSGQEKITYDGQKVFYLSCASNLGVSNSGNNWYLYKATDY